MRMSCFRVASLVVLVFSLLTYAASPVGDLDGNYYVDFEDLVLFAQQWMQYPDCYGAPGCGDVEGDDGVNLEDFALIAFNWQIRGEIALVINEVMASNDSTLEDPDEPGEYPDWIEIYNYGDDTVSLSGMYLRDDNNTWQIPAGISIEPDEYVLFWADDDDEQGDYHTTLKLGKSDDEVTLVSYDGETIVDSMSYSDQVTDVSYGRYPDASDDWYLMDAPSPELTNAMGMAGKVYFSSLGGTFTSSFSLTLSTTSPTAQIRYTTDGSIPSASSFPYTAPITISNSQTRRIRARAYDALLAPGPVHTEVYVPLAADIQTFTSNLPIVILDTHGSGISNTTYGEISSIFVDVDKDTGVSSMTDFSDFAGRGAAKIRGESSQAWPKKQYSLELWDENDMDAKASLLGMPSGSDWILNAPYGDKTLLRNVLAFKWSNDIENGFAAPGTKLVEVFLNDDGGNCSYADYNGIYVLMEKIKVSDNRVDIGSLDSGDIAEPDVTGGYILRVDKNNGQETFTTNANMVGSIQYYDPDETALSATQKSWIQNWLNTFETHLNASDFNDPLAGYAHYIDVENFIEYDMILELFKNADGFKLSTYFHKERNGKLRFGPQWDFNFSSGNTTNPDWWYPSYFSKASATEEGWFCDQPDFKVYSWHQRLLQDPDYMIRYADKWFEHREDKLSDAQITADIDTYYSLLTTNHAFAGGADNAADRNFAKWNILNNQEWCNYYFGYNAQLSVYDPYTGQTTQIPPEEREQANMPHTYHMETEWLKNWFNGEGTPTGSEWYQTDYSDRIGKLDALWQSDRNICMPPTLNINGTPMNLGGRVDLGDGLTMSSACAGTIYYTTDGTDPRTWTTVSNPGFAATLVAEDAAKAVLIPTETVSNDWKGGNEPFDDSTWTDFDFIAGKPGSVGYENSSGYQEFISYDVKNDLLGNNNTQSCLIRIPFFVDSAQLAEMTYLTLRVRHDDAFVAYINGIEVYRSSLVPNPLEWSSSADSYLDSDATNLVNYNISSYLYLLQAGGNNILAIHGLNSDSGSSDFLISAQLEAGAVSSGGHTPGGEISPSAVVYADPITLMKSEKIKARLKNGSDWGALNEACYSVGPVGDNLRITEIMYHPADPNQEFVEVRNIGASTINLAWVKFTEGIDFTFPDLSLGAGQYAVVVRNQAVFEALHGTGITIAGQFSGALDNGGEEIVLKDAFGAKILDFDYNDNWYPITDGAGFSLNIINSSNPDPNSWDDKDAWQASSVLNGSPGAHNPVNVVPNGAIVINEILTHSNDYPNDWIELHNTTGSEISIGGWFLSDNSDNFKKYQIGSGTSIPAYGYIVFTQDDNFGSSSSDPGRLVGFGLSELGEEVYLSSGSGGNLAGGYSVWQDFEAAEWDISFGRHVKSTAENNDVDFVLMQAMTYENSNSGPLIPDVIISEIMYNPSTTHDELGEYIELKNRTTSTVDLFDPANPSNTWKFTKGINYTFPPGVSISAGERILVVRTDPEIFRVIHPTIPAGVQVFGPFINSKLENDGEKIELSRPSNPEPGGFVPYIRVEQVNYSDGTHPIGNDPWPTTADGEGNALSRTSETGYSNDVSHWTAAAPTPGL